MSTVGTLDDRLAAGEPRHLGSLATLAGLAVLCIYPMRRFLDRGHGTRV